MNKRLQFVVLFFLIIINSFSLLHSQQEKVIQPLAQILQELEARYNIRFSYEVKNIEGLSITPLSSELTLEEALEELRIKTALNYFEISNRFISISPKDKDIQRLEEVIITNYLAKGISKTNTGAIEVDTGVFSLLPGLIEPDVLQIIQSLPGITSVDERISNINVRGGTNDQNLILFEGIRMYQSGHFFGLISAFNPYLVDEIKISKNGTSALYGNGVSSTISINNSDKVSNDFSGGIGANLLSLDGYTKATLGQNTELQLSTRRSFTDFSPSVTYDAYFDRIFSDSELNTSNGINTLLALDERFLYFDFNAKVLHEFKDTSKLSVNFLNINNSLDYNQIFTNSENVFQETESDLKQISYGMSALYSKVFNDNTRVSVESYYSNYDLEAQNNDISNNQKLKQENKVEDYSLKLNISRTIDNSTELRGGYQFNEVGVTNFSDVTNPEFTSLTKEIIRTHAFFGETERFSKSRKTYIRLGARISYFEKLKELVLEPRFAFNQKFNNYFRLEILGELKSQSISQVIDLQQDFFGIERRRWQLANTEENPLIKSQQISLGISYNKNNLLLSLEGYYKNVDNITTRSQGFQNQFQFTNDIGSFTITGLDFLVNKQFNNFSTWLSYSISNNNYNFDNINDQNSFPNTIDLTHVANTSITYAKNNLRIGFGINWHSGRAYTKPSQNQNNGNSIIEYGNPNDSRLPSYLRTDISAIYNFKISNGIKAELGASIWNILDKTNTINRYYTLDGNNDIRIINISALKFTPNLSFRINF